MPILKAGKPKKVPKWADLSEWGVSVMKKGQYVETHFHDGYEFVVMVSGRIRVKTEGGTHIIGPGDTVITKMGDTHDWLALEKSVSVWVTSRLRGRKRPGHLHRGS
jgi:quercetin dioxygenase-like cupin family protein